MRKLNILFFAILLAFLFSSLFFQKNTNAASVPDSVARRLRDSCDANGGWVYETTYENTKEPFSAYSKPTSVTGNWISSDPEGEKVISSIYEKNDFQISKNNRSFYLNVAAMGCS